MRAVNDIIDQMEEVDNRTKEVYNRMEEVDNRIDRMKSLENIGR